MTETTLSLFFPVYKDEGTVRAVAEKSLGLLPSLADLYELIIVDDGSPDRAGDIADEIAKEDPHVRVVHHSSNLGYGVAIRSGLAASRFEYICMLDGDDQYEAEDLRKLMKHKANYDLIITFRYKKVYSSFRIFVSWVYNGLLRFLFRIPYRDVSTGLRMVRRNVIEDIELESDSPFIGAELAIKAMLKGYRVGEVGIQAFPRTFGSGSSTSLRNILATIRDMRRIYRRVFSEAYDLPTGRRR